MPSRPRTYATGRWCWPRPCRTCRGPCTWPWSTRGWGPGGGRWRSRPAGRCWWGRTTGCWDGRPRRSAGSSGSTPSRTRRTGWNRCRGPSTGVTPAELGPEMDPGRLVRLERTGPQVDGDRVRASVVAVDHFGNLALDLRRQDLERVGVAAGDPVEVRVG